MVVPLYLPQVGWISIECLSKEKPEDVAARYMKKYNLGTIFKSVIADAVQKRKKNFNKYNVIEVVDSKK